MKKTLVLLTRPLDRNNPGINAKTLRMAEQVVLISDGVYNRPDQETMDEAYGEPGGHRSVRSFSDNDSPWPGAWMALDEDVKRRNVSVGCKLIGFPELIEAMESHERIITL